MNYLETIKRILDSDAGLIIEDMSQSKNKKVIDNRLGLIKQIVNQADNKDDKFYTRLIKLISYYINQLYNEKVEDFPSIVYDEKFRKVEQKYDELNLNDMFNLKKANE